MDLLITILKLAIVIFSFWGLSIYIYKKTKININFIPILTIGVIIIVMFFAGIINILNYVWLGLTLFGLYIFIAESIIFIRNKNDKKIILKIDGYKSYLGIIITLVVFAITACTLKNMIYLHYDNFTHWGLIIKEMFRIGSLPDSQTIVEFKLYPPGTALFIYYVTKIFGFKEAYTLIAQAFIIFMGILPIFAFYNLNKENKKQSIFKTVFSSLIYLSILVIILGFYPEQPLENLLVDVLLGTTALASTLSIIYYKKDMKNMLITQLIFAALLILIKNSGIIFMIFNTILALIYTFRYNIKGNENKTSKMKNIRNVIIVLVIIPIIIFFLWDRYTIKAYQTRQVGTSTHAMSPRNYYSNFIKKDINIIKSISINLVKESVNIDAKYNVFKTLILINLFILLKLFYYLIKKNKSSRKMFELLLFVNGVYVGYLLGLLMMYIFSMPLEEAKDLAGFHRYLVTVIIYLLGVTFSKLIISENNENINEDRFNYIALTSFVLLLIILNKSNINILKRTDISNERRVDIEKVLVNYDFLKNKNNKTLIYSDYLDGTSGYLTRVSKYILLNENVLVIEKEQYFKSAELYKNNDYIIDISKDNYSIKKIEKDGEE